jgi:DASS family divalent anion:Na+ symporter
MAEYMKKGGISKILLAGGCIVMALWAWFMVPPWEFSLPSWRLFILFFGVILAVLTQALSIFLAAILAMVIAVSAGILTPEKAFSGFSESFMILILSSFLVAKAIIYSGLGKRVALFFIRQFGHSTLKLGYCITLTDVLIGPAIPSNTARSGVLYPIVLSLAMDTGSKVEEGTRKKTGAYLMMVSITSLTISSALWFTAMAANPIGAGLAAKYQVAMDFSNWLFVSSVPCLVALILLPWLLYKTFPPEAKLTPEAPLAASAMLKEMGPMGIKEWITAVTFTFMVLGWVLATPLGLNLAIVCLAGLAVLIISNVFPLTILRREGGDALETFIWFAILYMMSSSLNAMGFMGILGQKISGQITSLSVYQIYVLLTVLYVLIHYLFVSQTAHMLALYGVFLEVAFAAGVPVALMAFSLSFATNYFAAMAPQGSSCNVFFVGSGYITPKEVYQQGAIVTLANLLIFLLATPWMEWASSFAIK